MRKIFVLFWVYAVLLFSNAFNTLIAHAEDYEGVVISCDQQNKLLKIEYLLEPPDGFWSKHKSDGINFYSLLVVKNYRVVRHKTKTFQCKIDNDIFEIVIEPRPFNSNLQGSCGAVFTGRATIYKNKKIILNNQAFDDSPPECLPDDGEIIKSIIVLQNATLPVIKRIKKHAP